MGKINYSGFGTEITILLPELCDYNSHMKVSSLALRQLDASILAKYIGLSIVAGIACPLTWLLVKGFSTVFGLFGEFLMMFVGLILFYVATFPWWLLTGVGYMFDHWQYFCFANCMIAGTVLGVRAAIAQPEDTLPCP